MTKEKKEELEFLASLLGKIPDKKSTENLYMDVLLHEWLKSNGEISALLLEHFEPAVPVTKVPMNIDLSNLQKIIAIVQRGMRDLKRKEQQAKLENE